MSTYRYHFDIPENSIFLGQAGEDDFWLVPDEDDSEYFNIWELSQTGGSICITPMVAWSMATSERYWAACEAIALGYLEWQRDFDQTFIPIGLDLKMMNNRGDVPIYPLSNFKSFFDFYGNNNSSIQPI